MSAQSNRQKIFIGPVIAFLVVALIAALLVIGLLIGRAMGSGGQQTPTASASSSPSASTQRPTFTQDLKIATGEGGSKTSPHDPSLPIGYEPTCKGAASAATNYLIANDPTRVSSGQLTKEDFLAMVSSIKTPEADAETSSNAAQTVDAMVQAQAPQSVIRPEWGGFSALECEEGKSATIGIIYATSFDGQNYLYGTIGYEMVWQDEDWKIAGTTEVEAPMPLPKAQVTEPDPQVVKLVGTQSQWENYTNA